MEMTNGKYYDVNAFAERPFEGNPGGVCFLDCWIDASLMQNIAAQNNLAETAFVVATPEPHRFEIRWFSPGGEIDLNGHCTLGASRVLFQMPQHRESELTFFSPASGQTITVTEEDGLIAMDFPANAPAPCEGNVEIEEALGARPSEVLKTKRDLMAVFDSEETVRDLKPDFRKMRELPHGESCYVTALSDDPAYDVVARAFWPKHGVDEDPVCGSMHTTLMPYWGQRLNTSSIVCRNFSKRGGVVICRERGDRVLLCGHANLYLEGEILL